MKRLKRWWLKRKLHAADVYVKEVDAAIKHNRNIIYILGPGVCSVPLTPSMKGLYKRAYAGLSVLERERDVAVREVVNLLERLK